MCVSSLTAIMMDQKSKFTPRGLVTELVGETQDDPAAVKRVVEGKVQLVFISPENSERHSLSKDAADTVHATKRSWCHLSWTRHTALRPGIYDTVTLCLLTVFFCTYRGDLVRTAFSHIGELRSVIPSAVGVMALTATVTTATLEVVTKCLFERSRHHSNFAT